MQLKLALIPEYKDSRLYESLVETEPKMFIGSGYDGEKELVFYNTDIPCEQLQKNETGRIKFPNFRMAYKFIIDNDIKNFNIDFGSWDKQIKRYQKECKDENRTGN